MPVHIGPPDWTDLPAEFDTKTYLQTAHALAIASKTAEKYITAWCKAGQLVRVAQGKYSINTET